MTQRGTTTERSLVIRIKAPNVQPLAECVAIEARNLAPLPEDFEDTVGASLPISGLTARRTTATMPLATLASAASWWINTPLLQGSH